MLERRSLAGWLLLGCILAIVLPILGNVVLHWLPGFFPEVGRNIPLHAVVETMGGLMALAIAGILRSEYDRKQHVGHYPWLAAGLMGMGVLDLFHAAALPGNTFVWLHSCATFVGGVFFGWLWFSRRDETRRWVLELPWVILIGTMAFSIGSSLWPDLIPVMNRESQFTPMAMFLNVFGGFGFLAASAYFIGRFVRSGDHEDWLFAVHAGLFGAAGILFRTSSLWDGAWWWWHYLRLAAYLAALLYALRTYLTAEYKLRQLNLQLSELNSSLDRTIEIRTEKLRASEERFQLAIRGTSDGLWDWNVLTMEVYYSPRFKQLLGYTDEEFPNVFESFESHLHPEDYDSTMEKVRLHLNDHVPYDVTYRLRLKNSDYRWFRARGQAIWDEQGRATRMAGSITDITDEMRLRERFRKTVEASPTALLVANEQGTIILANSHLHKMFGYEPEELVGQPIETLVPQELRAKHVGLRAGYFQAPSMRAMGESLDLRALRKDSSTFPVQIGLNPMELEEGPAVICGIVDITDQRKTLEAMQHAKEAAESANLAKSSFLANMSHEIRTPMNGIIGMSQLLSHTQLQPHQREYLNTIDESAHILLRLLNDILDFSKIEAGKLELESIDFQLSEYVGRATQMLGLRAAEKGLELACRIAPDVPDQLRGDPGRLQQILVNLINNAIKFTDVGEIYVDINLEDGQAQADGRVRLQFSVKDTGIGIESDKREKVFSAFEQAESSTTRRFGGTGLGLAISRQLVEMMGGRIWVDSEFGRGSTFHFTGCFESAPDAQFQPPAALEFLQGLRVLVVDDNRTNRRILGELLIHWRMAPELAESAHAAREALARNHAAGNPTALILLDQAMPYETGLEFAASVRANDDWREIPIILIASAVEPADVNRGNELQIARVMSKPVVATDLLNEILRIFAKTPEESRPAPEVGRPSHVLARRVLLVEDNEINRRVAIGLLEARGHHVAIAENGAEAVDMLESDEFDVVLMDMQMPIMDGYEATRRIREREREVGGHIPIIAMTAEALKGDRERCLAAGMDDYIPKPVTTKELYPKVEKYPAVCISSQHKLDVPVLSATESDSSTDELLDAEGVDNLPVIDWEAARENIPGGEDMLRELAVILRAQAQQLLSEMASAIRDRNAASLRRAAHTLKGAAGHFAARRVMSAAAKLEQLGRSASFERADELFNGLQSESAEMLKALQSELLQD